MLWTGVHGAFQTPVARTVQIHVAVLVLRFPMPSRQTFLLQISPRLTITAKILPSFRMSGNVPLVIRRFRISSTSPTVSLAILLMNLNECLQHDSSKYSESRLRSSAFAHNSLTHHSIRNLHSPTSIHLPQQYSNIKSTILIQPLL